LLNIDKKFRFRHHVCKRKLINVMSCRIVGIFKIYFHIRLNILNYDSLESGGSVVYIRTTKGTEFKSQQSQEFLLLSTLKTGSGVYPGSYPLGTGGSFLG
jgi:hypothetical protein